MGIVWYLYYASGARACGLLVALDLGQGAECVNIKLAQLINVKQAELGQAHRRYSVMLAVLIIILLNDGSFRPAYKVLLDFYPNKPLKSSGSGKTEEALANPFQDLSNSFQQDTSTDLSKLSDFKGTVGTEGIFSCSLLIKPVIGTSKQ